ncbi:MAG: SDR family oxidoreductase [Bacteroidaceae bacterium]|nr:SDR family oxidoreductase [Bacteroidaceae bacterium]MDE6000571.1 SDR family oxidoreductase [Bacteroidaceae bacterium]
MIKSNGHINALVAGGAGFIGSHLCDRLVEDGYRVLCMDNLYTGRMENIHHLLRNPNFSFVNHDVTIPISYDGVSLIFNLACPASPTHYQKDAIYTTKTAVLGTLNLLEVAKANHCPILQASTSEVYGDPLVHPQPEEYYGNVNPVGIRSCYDEGKRCAESLCMDYHRQYGVQVKVIRIFNTYGPRMAKDDGRVVSNFIAQALSGKAITIYGDGSQTRSFQYVDDLIEAMMRVVKTGHSFTGPINLGNPHEIAVQTLAEMVITLTHSHSQIISRPLPENDPKRRCPNISLAMQQLGEWMPTVKIEEGLSKTIEYFRKEYS